MSLSSKHSTTVNICYVLFNYEDSIVNFNYFVNSLSSLSDISWELHLYLHNFDSQTIPPWFSNIRHYISSYEFVSYESDLVSFGQHSQKSLLSSSYDYYLFLNSSCIGPILPSYIDINLFFHHLLASLNHVSLISSLIEFPRDNLAEKILPSTSRKCIPPSISNLPFFHTFFFICQSNVLSDLVSSNSFPPTSSSKTDAVLIYERLISANLLNLNHSLSSISCLLRDSISCSNLSDWDPDLHSNSRKGFETCPEIPYNYYESDLHPLDCVFYKNIRFPSLHRGDSRSGISESNNKFLSRYLLKYSNEV